tara:strand:+ start:652 stop:1089 length:438 start_codon:yes stop_codon:yes gene_type:complete
MPKPGKIELPLASYADICELAEQHAACTLPYVNWTHRAHLALALFYLNQLSLDAAIVKIRNNIKAYNLKCGDGMGYHETITVLFMKKIHTDLQQDKHQHAIEDELIRLVNSCTVEWLYNYYSKELLWSDLARQTWTDPDLKALDF